MHSVRSCRSRPSRPSGSRSLRTSRSYAMRSWLVVCSIADRSALWAYQGLRRYVPQVQLVTADVLACSLSWQHRIAGGRTSTAIKLTDGRLIADDALDGVINRLTA